MQRIFTLLVVLAFSLGTFAQTSTTPTPNCEARESKLLTSFGAISSIAVYNTYITVGGITDLWVAKSYDDARVKTLFEEQKSMLSTLIDYLDKLVKEKGLKEKDDAYYVQELSSIFKGLKKQIDFFLEYTKDKSDSKISAYDNQRKKNWDNIAKLLGLDN